MTTTVMIVMEPGSAWPGQVGDSTNLVAFSHGGEDLLRMTQAKLDVLERSKQGVRVAILACNSETGSAPALRRSRLAHLLLGTVTRATCGRLILTASGRSSSQLRQELLALTGHLTDDLLGTTASISLRFTEAPHAGLAPEADAPALPMTGTHA